MVSCCLSISTENFQITVLLISSQGFASQTQASKQSSTQLPYQNDYFRPGRAYHVSTADTIHPLIMLEPRLPVIIKPIARSKFYS